MEQQRLTLPDGRQVCRLGQGTYQMGRRRGEGIAALCRGSELGLQVIDIAEMYGNEDLVDEAVHGCRGQAFIVSKVLPGNASYDGTKQACERSLRRLLHRPLPVALDMAVIRSVRQCEQ